MPAPPTMVFDGISSQLDGMNNGLDGSLLPVSQLQLLINGTVRGAYVQQRPGHNRVMQIFSDTSGFFQHAGWLRTNNGQVLLVAVRDGRFFRIDPLQKTVHEFTIPGDPNPSTLTNGWSMPGGAEGFWVYQDGQTAPLIWTGGDARRATQREIKPGTVMSYTQGRIWYSLPNGLAFRATDLVGSKDSGSAIYNYKDSILKETENTFLNEGGDFAVPANSGGIRGMAPTAILDTSQGQGPLQVFCVQTVFSVNTPVDRDIWKAVKYPIQTVSVIGSGALAAQSTINLNGDIFMRSLDGIRSYIVARRDFRDWGNTPQSYEISNILKYDQEDLLAYGSAAVFDNRLLMTLSPSWSESGVFHRGLAVMDLSPITSLKQQGSPCYDGIWTGYQILAIVPTDIGTYLFVLCADGTIDLWQLTKDQLYDDSTGRIQMTFVPRTLFNEHDADGRPIWRLKRLETADLFYDQLGGPVDFVKSWKPDGYPCWAQWHQWSECAPICTTILGCTPPATFFTQYRPRMRLPTPPDLCRIGSKKVPLRDFYQLNVRLDVTGPSRIRGLRVGAIVQGEPVYRPNCDSPECEPVTCCEFDPFTYVAKGTLGPGFVPGSGGSGGSGGTNTTPGGGGGTGGQVGGHDGTEITNTNNTTTTSDFPNLPPHNRLPTFPNPPSLNCLTFFGSWVDPGPPDPNGNEHGMGMPAELPTGLQSGVLELWADSLWEQFANYAKVNNFNVSACQIVQQFAPGSNQRNYEPNQVFLNQFYVSGLGRDWVLAIEHCIT